MKFFNGFLALLLSISAVMIGIPPDSSFASNNLFTQNAGYDQETVDIMEGGYEEGAYDKKAINPMNPVYTPSKNSNKRYTEKEYPYVWKINNFDPKLMGKDGTMYGAVGKEILAVTPMGKVLWRAPGHRVIGLRNDDVILVMQNIAGHNKTMKALDTKNGKELWSFKSAGLVENGSLDAAGTYYTGVYENFDTLSIRAIDKDGQLKWEQKLSLSFSLEGLVLSKKGIIYTTSKNQIVAINKEDGSIKFTKKVGSDNLQLSTPAIRQDGFLLVGVNNYTQNGTSFLAKIDPNTGSWVSSSQFSNPGFKQIVFDDQLNLYTYNNRFVFKLDYQLNKKWEYPINFPFKLSFDFNKSLLNMHDQPAHIINPITGKLEKKLARVQEYQDVYNIYPTGEYYEKLKGFHRKPILPSNQKSVDEHTMKIKAQTEEYVDLKYLFKLPSDHDPNTKLIWDFSFDGVYFYPLTDKVGYLGSAARIPMQKNLGKESGFVVRSQYINKEGRSMVYQVAIVNPDLYSGVPLPKPDDYVQDGPEQTTPPSPTLKADKISQTSITASWTEVPNVDHYTIKRNDVVIYQGKNLSVIDNGLTPNTEYTYSISGTTKAGESQPTILSTKTLSITSAEVSQPDASKDSVSFRFKTVEGGKKYVVHRNPEWTYQHVSGNSFDLSYRNTKTGEGPISKGTVESVNGEITHKESGLHANQSFTYTVTAYDVKGNASSPVQVTAQTKSLSQNTSLKSLSVSPEALSPAFNPSQNKYNVTVPYDTTFLKVKAQATDDELSTVKVNNTLTSAEGISVPLQVGTNTIQVEVTSEDKTKEAYTIQAIREKGQLGHLSINATNITKNSANLLWNDLGTDVTYKVKLLPADGTGILSGNKYGLTNLKPNMTYRAQVTASKKDFENKVAEVSFTTKKEPIETIAKPRIQSVSLLNDTTVRFVIESKSDFVEVNGISKAKQGNGSSFVVDVPSGTRSQSFTIIAKKGGVTSDSVTITLNILDIASKIVDSTTISIMKSGTKAKISWKPVSGVSSYLVVVRKQDSTSPLLSVEVSSSSTLQNVSDGDYEIIIYPKYQDVWSKGSIKKVTYQAPPAPTQEITNFVAKNGKLKGSIDLSWKGTKGVTVIELKQNGAIQQTSSTRFTTITFYNLKNGSYDVYVAGKLVGNFNVSTGKSPSPESGGGKKTKPSDLKVTDGDFNAKIISWKNTSGLITIELKQNNQTKYTQQTRFRTANFYNVAPGTYDIYVASAKLGEFTIDGINKPSNVGEIPTEATKNLQIKDGPLKGSKILSWEGTSDTVTVELKQGEVLKASKNTRYTTAAFYNVVPGTYDVYVAGTKLGEFTMDSASKEKGNEGGTPAVGAKNLQIKDGPLKGSKILSWEGTSKTVTVELKQGEVLKASKNTRYTTAAFYNVAPGTYDVYVAGTKLGEFSMDGASKEKGNEGGTPTVAAKNLQIKDGPLKGSKILSWEGTSDTVSVELKQGEVLKSSKNTRYTTTTFYNVTPGTYDVYVASTKLGEFTIDGISKKPGNEGVRPIEVAKNLQVKNGPLKGSRILTWEGTSNTVTVELKQGEVLKASKNTRYTTATFYNVASGIYDVYVAGTKLGEFTMDGASKEKRE
ncbi:cadherin-like beta sandwich domain-containing protein [Brevibacillus laterosporus]|uniref:cadherin-like beta sandwich domain-containing protein n=1 Tax=Brevibacillus laterosporus TaxID=1465 RepID=UPI0035A6143D